MDFESANPSVVKSIRQRDLLNTWLRLYARAQSLPRIEEYQPERLEDEPVKDAPALLGVIVNGMVQDYFRSTGSRRREEPAGLAHDLAELADSRPLTYETHTFGTRFDSAVRELDPDDRDAYILTELRGLPEREAADVLGTSQPTVHRRAEAARTFVRKELTVA